MNEAERIFFFSQDCAAACTSIAISARAVTGTIRRRAAQQVQTWSADINDGLRCDVVICNGPLNQLY